MVASAPAGHPYVASIASSPFVRVLPDPPVPGAPAGVWWPPAVLQPEWIFEHRTDAQLLHIHFGTESFAPGHLTAVIDAAHAVSWPVIFTVHDLEHPQLGDQAAYDRQLDELVRGADALVTLTEGAASMIAQRWAREALVVAHPSVLAWDAALPPARSFDEVLIGVHLKDLRPNVDGPGTVAALLRATAELRARGINAVAEVRMHHRVRDEAARREVRLLCAADEHVVLIEHERLEDPQLVVSLSRLDAYVLPYRHGTHSGWLELCWDLGLAVAAPAVGFYAEQHADGSVRTFAGDGAPAPAGGGETLAEALAALLTDTASTHAGTEQRAAVVAARRAARRISDAAGAEAHADLYRRLLADDPREATA